MWNITSNNVQRAKERLQLRRAEIETRYAEEKKALDAEFAVIETLERAASEFMLKLNRENGAIPLEPTAPTDPPGGDEQDSNVAIVAEPSQPAAPIDMPGGGELGSSLEGFAPQPAAESDQVGRRQRNRRRSGHPQTRIALAALPRQSCARSRRHRRRCFLHHGLKVRRPIRRQWSWVGHDGIADRVPATALPSPGLRRATANCSDNAPILYMRWVPAIRLTSHRPRDYRCPGRRHRSRTLRSPSTPRSSLECRTPASRTTSRG